MEKILKLRLANIILVDALFCAIVYILPTISHFLAFPLYKLDPMRIIVIGGLIFTNKKNALFLASTLPFISYMIGGHPVIFKSLLITIELLVNLLVLIKLESRYGIRLTSILLSIFISKIVYYILKSISVYFGLMESEIFSTNFGWQIIVAIIISFVYVHYKERFSHE